jgi:colanic acid/amylovoran biosynthesis glycosyltransferase
VQQAWVEPNRGPGVTVRHINGKPDSFGDAVVSGKTLKVGYLVYEFPKLSETFVLDEIKGHVENGLDVSVISLLPVSQQSPARANLAGLPISLINIFRFRRRRLRTLEKILPALLEVAQRPHLFPILFDQGIGGLNDRVIVLSLARQFRLNQQLANLDLLHCHFGPNGRYAAVLKEYGAFTGPIVTTFHAYEVTSLLRRMAPGYYDTLFHFGSLFLPISDFWVPRLIELGCDPSRIHVHRMGIDPDSIQYQEHFPEQGSLVRLISTGRLIEKKGHTYTLRALALLKERHPEISFSLDIIGDGPDETVLKAEAARLGLNDIVRFHGGLPHRRTLEMLREATIFVLPSVTAKDGDMEGIPVSIMEAMAMGLPVIATFHSGIPELVEDGVSGRLVPERDAEALAAAISSVAETPDKGLGFARAARKKVEESFNRRLLNAQLKDLYLSALSGHEPAPVTVAAHSSDRSSNTTFRLADTRGLGVQTVESQNGK